MTTAGRQTILASVLATGLLLTCALTSQGQELNRLTGSVTTGYEGLQQNDSSYRSPFLGLGANLQGFWMNPKVLSFGVQPNLMVGHHFLGPLMGPAGNGVNAQTTFLGGSRMPLTVAYTHQNVSLPAFMSQEGTSRGATTIQRSLAITWSTNFRRWPSLSVHYSRSRNTIESPFQLERLADMKNQLLDIGSSYSIAKWDLEGRFTNGNATNPSLDSGPNFLEDRSHDRMFSFLASRPLPWRSFLVLDAVRQDFDLRTAGQDNKTAYTRLNGRFRSSITNRVSFSVETAYLSNAGDFLRQQVLVGPGTNQPPNVVLITSGVSTLATTGGVQVQVAKGLMAHGEASKTVGLSQSDQSAGIDATGVGGGVTYSRSLFRGQFSAGYSYASLDSQGSIRQKTNQHNVTAFYSRQLPRAFRLTTSGHYNKGSQTIQFSFPTKSYGAMVELSRRVAGSWTISGLFDLRKNTYTYPANNSSLSKGFGFTISSQKLLAGISHHLDSGLAYRFGGGIVPLPNGSPSVPLNGLPPLILTDGNSTYVDATYRPLKRMRIIGQWSRSRRSLSTGEQTRMRGLDVRAEYDFRKLRMSGGFVTRTQEIGAATLTAWRGKTFYVQVTRNFRIF